MIPTTQLSHDVLKPIIFRGGETKESSGGPVARVCAACGKKIGLFEDKMKCKRCDGWLCKDCKYVAVQSNRCPACGNYDPV